MNVQLFVEITEYMYIFFFIHHVIIKKINFFFFILDHTVYLLQLYVRVHESLCIKVTWLYGYNFILFYTYTYSLIMIDFFYNFEFFIFLKKNIVAKSLDIQHHLGTI